MFERLLESLKNFAVSWEEKSCYQSNRIEWDNLWSLWSSLHKAWFFTTTGKKALLATRFNYWRRQWQPTPVLLPGKYLGQRSLVGCSPWGRKESDMTEGLHFHFSLSCIGEGDGNPLQCSCLENPRDRGAWWAAVYGVTQSWTWLKQCSSSRFNYEMY